MPLTGPNQEVTTTQPFLTVPAGLQPGRYVFQLVVVDEAGMRSAPMRRLVTIQQRIIKPNPDPVPDPGPIKPGPIHPPIKQLPQ